VDGDDGRGLLAGDVEAMFRRKLRDLLAVLVDIEQSVLGIVVGVRVLAEALADQTVRSICTESPKLISIS